MATFQGVVPSNIRAEMARRRVPQKALATGLGITQQAVSQKLAGTRPISVDELARIAEVLGIAAGDLMAESSAPAQGRAS